MGQQISDGFTAAHARGSSHSIESDEARAWAVLSRRWMATAPAVSFITKVLLKITFQTEVDR